MTSEKEQDQQEQQPAAEGGEQQPEQTPNEAAQESNQAPESPQHNNQQQQPQPQPPPPQQQQSQRPRAAVHKADYEKDIVYMYQFARTATGPVPSPFCIKVETWLRITETKFENVDHRLKFKSKKGQLPFVELNGSEIADSAIIIRDLSKYFGKDMDASLTAEQRTLSHALCIMLDHHTGWVYRWWIYNHPADYIKSFKINTQHLLNSKVPSFFLNFIMKMKLKGKKKSALAHGLGLHSPEEIFEFGKADLITLQELIGDKDFFFGDEPTLLDIVAFAHLLPILGLSSGSFPFKAFVEEECPKLVSLVERIKERYWKDWDQMCESLDTNTHLPKKKEEEVDEKENKEKNGGEKEKSGSGTPDEKESEPEKEKIEKDEKEKEKEVDEGDNKAKEGLEEKAEEKNKD